MQGWIKLHRKIMDNKIWLSEPFTRGQAWIDLLMLANHKPGVIRIRGNRIEVARGQVGWSQRTLAERWKWSRGKVIRFLLEIEKTEHMIEPQKNNITSLINIINYEIYQGDDTIDSTTDSTTDGPQTVPQTGRRQYQNKNDKNINNEKNDKNEKNKEVVIPEWLPPEAWEKYRDHRRAMKSRMTKTAEELALAKLIKFRDYGNDPIEVINQSIENGWKGLFELKDGGSKKLGSDNPHKGKISDACWATMKIGQDILKRDKEKEGQKNAGQNPFQLSTDPIDK